MKKNLVSLVSLVCLVGLVSLTSCKKENQLGNGTQFRATMEDCTSAKTTLDGTALNWVSGDQIAVYGTAGAGIYSATPQTPATVAVFDNVSGNSGNAPFRAFYPATLTTNGVNITLPATQSYVAGSIHEFPMYAESSNEELSFKNLCGVLKLHLTKANTSISTITITAASEINGTFSVNYNSGDPELTYSANGTNTIALECATPQSITEGKDFYIYLPEGSYSGLQIQMNTDDGRYCVKTANTAINVTRSQYTLITLGSTLEFRPIGSKGGLFTVGVVDQDTIKVWFSQGNLQYQASTDTWRFAENQYDYVGGTLDGVMMGNVYENGVLCNNALISPTYSGWIDLFGWGTGSNPTLASTNNSDYGTFVDWGSNAINNGGNATNSGWRTLSQAEWRYLFRSRVNASTKYGIGNINGVGGMVILPDSWVLPDGCTFRAGMASSYDDWTRNTYTLAQWAEMESAGAVFLPAAGYRSGTELFCVGSIGSYWSSTPVYSVYNAGCAEFGSDYPISMNGPTRCSGSSVRPVWDNN